VFYTNSQQPIADNQTAKPTRASSPLAVRAEPAERS